MCVCVCVCVQIPHAILDLFMFYYNSNHEQI